MKAMIHMLPVQSSQIHSIGFDSTTKTLAVRFKAKDGPGSLYHYAGVPAKTFSDMQQAESIGRYFGEHIKGGGFEFAKIDENTTEGGA